jgi:hypothetical protein
VAQKQAHNLKPANQQPTNTLTNRKVGALYAQAVRGRDKAEVRRSWGHLPADGRR